MQCFDVEMHDIEGSSWVKERYDDYDHWVDGLSMARSNIEVCGVNNVATNSINRWANLIIIDTWYLSSLSFTVVVHDVHLVYLIGRLIVPGLPPPLPLQIFVYNNETSADINAISRRSR